MLKECIKETILYESQIIPDKKLPIYIYDFHAITSLIDVNIDLGKQLQQTNDSNALFNDFIEKSKPNTTYIYTDGSKIANTKSVGSACYCKYFYCRVYSNQ